MTQQQWEKEVINQFYNKLTNQTNDLNFSNIIYELFQETNDPIWDCRNLFLIGFGEIVGSNSHLLTEPTNTLLNQEYNDTIVCLQNKVNEQYLCLRFGPTKGNQNQYEGIIMYDTAVFNTIKQGIQNQNNWLVCSTIGDQIEIQPFATQKYNFHEFLSPFCLKFNDECVKQLQSGNLQLYSTIVDKSNN